MYLVEASDRLIVNEMRADLGTTVIGREIIVLEQTGSTNEAILRIATTNSKERLVLFDEHQTEGRGQRGNRRESASGKWLWISILLKPRIDVNNASRRTTWS